MLLNGGGALDSTASLLIFLQEIKIPVPVKGWWTLGNVLVCQMQSSCGKIKKTPKLKTFTIHSQDHLRRQCTTVSIT